jgi:general stress protein CsbA
MAKTLAYVFGVVFLLVGILGFVDNPLVGANGIFETDTLHNLVHLIFGIILLAIAMKAAAQSALWLKILGVVYLILAILGFVMGGDALLGLVHANTADHWLHLVLGIVLVGAGLSLKGKSMPSGGGM